MSLQKLTIWLLFSIQTFQLSPQQNLDAISAIRSGFNGFMSSRKYSRQDETSRYSDSTNTFEYEIYKHRENNDCLLFAKKDNYTKSISTKSIVFPKSGSMTLSFDDNIVQKMSKPADMDSQYLKSVEVTVIQSNCEYLMGVIVGQPFEPKMQLFTGQDVKAYMIDSPFGFLVDNADQSLFDLQIYTFNLPEINKANPFPAEIKSSDLKFESIDYQNNEDFYIICPYFSSSSVNIVLTITPTYAELPIIIVFDETQDCSINDDAEDCEKKNSDQIKEFIDKFDDTENNLIGTKIEITTTSEDEQANEKFTVETSGGVFTEKEVTITAKLGIHKFLLIKKY